MSIAITAALIRSMGSSNVFGSRSTKTRFLKCPQRMKSQGVKSGDLDGCKEKTRGHPHQHTQSSDAKCISYQVPKKIECSNEGLTRLVGRKKFLESAASCENNRKSHKNSFLVLTPFWEIQQDTELMLPPGTQNTN